MIGLPDFSRTLHIGSRRSASFASRFGDGVGIGVPYLTVLVWSGFATAHGFGRALLIAVGTALAGAWLLRAQGPPVVRLISARALEVIRVTRSVLSLGLVVLVADRIVGLELSLKSIVIASLFAVALVVTWRLVQHLLITHDWTNGERSMRLVVVGADSEASRLIGVFATHPEMGIDVVGVIGEAFDAAMAGLGELWLGELEDTEHLVGRLHASDVVIVPGAAPTDRMNELVDHFDRHHVQLHMATGMSGIDARRVRMLDLVHESMFHVDAPRFSQLQRGVKRIFDITVSTFSLVLLSPVLVVTAVAIKLTDGGPVFFKQRRVGHKGIPFAMLKFRTMVIDAEARLADLTSGNERSGPLFKMTSDPRITRIGRFLRESSLDEVPQLLNVLRGQMSLIGPRPALPSEVEAFPPDLRAREQVLPGITGLWQVEARDNPSFDAYRRLDLFYVKNWSVTLDTMIVLATAERLFSRLVRTVFKRPKRATVSIDGDASPSRARGMVRDNAAALVLQALMLITGLASFYVVARRLGSTEYGLYVGIYAVLFPISGLAYQGTLRHLMQLLRQQRVPEHVGLRRALRGGFPLLASGFVAAIGLCWLLFGPSAVAPALLLVVNELVLGALVEGAASLQQCRSGYASSFALKLAPIAGRAMSVALIVALGIGSLLGVAAMSLFSTAVCVALCLALRPMRGVRLARQSEMAGVGAGHDLRSSALLGTDLFAVGAQTDADKVVLASSAFRGDAGVYAAAYKLVQLALMPVNALLDATHVRLISSAESEPTGPLRFVRRLSLAALLYALVALPVLWWLFGYLPRILGEQYADAANIGRALSIVLVLRAPAILPLNGLLAYGRVGLRTAISVGSGVVGVVLYLILIPMLSWRGAVIGTLVSEAVLLTASWIALTAAARGAAPAANRTPAIDAFDEAVPPVYEPSTELVPAATGQVFA